MTERAVFKLKVNGLELIEIAPGVDFERDIIQQMAFRPTVSESLSKMDARLFNEDIMGIKNEWLEKQLGGK